MALYGLPSLQEGGGNSKACKLRFSIRFNGGRYWSEIMMIMYPIPS